MTEYNSRAKNLEDRLEQLAVAVEQLGKALELWVSDYEATERNLTIVQARCTELLEENRQLKERVRRGEQA